MDTTGTNPQMEIKKQVITELDIQTSYKWATIMLLHEKKDSVEVINNLVERGVDQETATRVVENVIGESERSQRAQRSKGKDEMLYGAICCIGGIAFTLITYFSSSRGGIYFIAWGAILFGLIQFLNGWRKSQTK